MRIFGFNVERSNGNRGAKAAPTLLLLREQELPGIFAVADTTPWWRAVLQVIAELEDKANKGAQTAVANHGICASCVGGAEHLGMLRDELVRLREEGLRGRREGQQATPNVQRSTSNVQ